jgi:hypothetical protein
VFRFFGYKDIYLKLLLSDLGKRSENLFTTFTTKVNQINFFLQSQRKDYIEILIDALSENNNLDIEKIKEDRFDVSRSRIEKKMTINVNKNIYLTIYFNYLM